MPTESATKNNKMSSIKKFLSEYNIIVITVAMIIIATILEGTTFFSLQNFLNIIRNNSVLGIIALGMAFVIITGNIDLSVGAQLVVAGTILLSVLNATGSIVIAILACLVSSCLISLLTSVIVTKGKVPSFIVTLGMSYVLRSVATFVMDARGMTGSVEQFKAISNTVIGGVFPLMILYFIIMFVIYFYISKYTVIGRRIYAVGSNEKATRLSGINTDRVKMIAFLLLGLAVGVAAIMEASRMNSINSTSSGLQYELNAIAMAVVGGVAMEGGKGKMVNVLFGVFILGIINNILTLVGMNVYLVSAVKGAIIIFATLAQRKDKEN